MRPISPLIRLRLMQILVRRYKVSPESAVTISTDLIEDLQKAGLDIVSADWVNQDHTTKEGTVVDFWEGVRQLRETLDEATWTPWRPE